jgi:hypothetical protein
MHRERRANHVSDGAKSVAIGAADGRAISLTT